jgi:hypothetical protein
MLMREAAKEYNWTLNYGSIALIWRAAASSARSSWAGSRRRSTAIPNLPTCCWTIISTA